MSLVLYPSTAEDSVSQFVRLTLALTLDRQVPRLPPVSSSLSKALRCLTASSSFRLVSIPRRLRSSPSTTLAASQTISSAGESFLRRCHHTPESLSCANVWLSLLSVRKCLQAEAQSWLGSPVLYQLIEVRTSSSVTVGLLEMFCHFSDHRFASHLYRKLKKS